MKHTYQILFSCAVALMLSVASSSILALDVKITQDIGSISVHQGDDLITIQRIQDQSNVLTGGFTKTSRKCPPFCIQPFQAAPGVTTVGELELLTFLEKNRIDLAVMGAYGLSGMGFVLFGSVAKRVVHKAPCSVMIVRSRNKEVRE